ncbi:MAG: DUF481 domain-containing protein [Kiritimatiellae bacterium]|nr:DUF481 domain-containing protein [Kiritimatiellia bacterium]MDD4735423.1 DUF481 domain-containing protein [Kiritimatiellia bacterium]
MRIEKSVAAVLLAVALLAAGTYAEDAVGGKMETSLNAGLTLTDGNSETMQGNASLIAEGEKDLLGSLLAGVEFNYGDSKNKDGEKENTISNVKIYGNAKKTLSVRTFGYLDAGFFHDDIAAISYRIVVGPGGGYYLIKNEMLSLCVEAGPSYLVEKVDGSERDYLVLRMADRLEWKLSETAKIWQAAEFLPRVDDTDNYLLNGELGVEAAMTTRISLRLVLQDRYNSRPAEGKKHNDLTLIAGVGIKL